jgi:hypothetical protein
MLTDASRRQLQRLRFLVEEALARTQDPTEIGRHSALVLLDGACEYAMSIALGHRGQSIPRTFPQKFEALRAELDDWRPDAWASVLQLHEARNQVQHQGTVPDSRSMPSWAAQAQRFIDSVVVAAFDVELPSVLVADSIESEDVYQALVEAEHALLRQDAAAAFEAAIVGFDIARQAWRGQRADAIGQLRLQYSGLRHLADGIETDPTNLSLLRFEDLLEVQPFAPDIGEYHWLLARRAEAEQNIASTMEVAQRTFVFVVAWVLRWEAFAARYESRQYPPPPPPYEPPITGADSPVIFDADVEVQHHIGNWLDTPTLENVRYSINVTLADLPDVDRDLWAKEVGGALNELIAERGFDHVGAANISAGGIVRFHAVSPGVTSEEILAWINRALIEGGKRYRETISEREDREVRLPSLRESLADAVGATEAGDLVLGVASEVREDGSVWIGAQLRRDEGDPMLGHLLDSVVQGARSGRTGLDYHDTTVWFDTDFDPKEAAALIEVIATAYCEQALDRRRRSAEVEDRRLALRSEILSRAAENRE